MALKISVVEHCSLSNPFKLRSKKTIFAAFLFLSLSYCAQNPLFIPPSLNGPIFNLNIQSGISNFYSNYPTPTYGINGVLLSPTIIVNKGDHITLNVNNGLNVATSMHWHGLHVAPENDGGPHQSIAAGTTWSPNFEILNNAGTFWYHPHGLGKTDLHVSKGLAGMFIIHDAAELALGLPQTYGVDDIPLIVQSKAFDILNQIAIADHMDTAIFVNGTLNAFINLPAQVVRLRLVNGSSMRTFNFGFSNNNAFYQIATDGGLIASPILSTRIQLAPGERTEILVDLSLLVGQTFDLNSYASEMPNGIFGSPSVGVAPDTLEMYNDNLLNGNDFKLLQINVVNPTTNAIHSIPNALVPYLPLNEVDATVNRRFVFDTITLFTGNIPNLAEGPFAFNLETFHMDSINEIIELNATETWTLINNTHLAHPFHIHDIQFNVIEKSGAMPSLSEQGWKDVVLVMPHDSVKFIIKFTTFADDMIPYMYHCHLLHHEDDGMMGSFLVIDPMSEIDEVNEKETDFSVYPNPTNGFISLKLNLKNTQSLKIELFDVIGQKVFSRQLGTVQGDLIIPIDVSSLHKGSYSVKVTSDEGVKVKKITIQ